MTRPWEAGDILIAPGDTIDEALSKMDSSGWLEVLRDAAEHIVARVSQARVRGAGLETRDFKHLLDDAAQGALVDTLTRRGVSAQLISEEGDVLVGTGGPIVIADPIDGTTNLSRGMRPAVTCLSVSEDGTLDGTLAALVSDIYTGETYTAEKGRGALLDGRPIRVAAPRSARASLISMDITKNPKLNRVAPLLDNCRYLRMLGSSATELSLVASGNLDAHLDIRGTLRATDVVAALTILREAGGVYAVDGAHGGDIPLTKTAVMELVAASNTQLLDELLALTKCP
jgi:myo-inositol-1(or 4)-monophosphatase